VVSKTGAILAINGGFFTPGGNPLGSVISAGKRAGNWNSASSLGSGIYRINSQGRASISRRSSFSDVSASKELLQAGPLLVENRKPIRGLQDQKTASRTILLNDGGDRWWVGIASPCTLAELGRILARTSPAGWPVANALNLDGGRSSELYVSSDLRGGPIERRGVFNRPVRNFLILEAR
jgi:exopolysaccharide biosynthesis protein